MDAAYVEAWRAICQAIQGAFTQPTFTTFLQVATGWVLCRSRPTVTNLVCTIGEDLLGHAAKHWTVYERFFSRAEWSLAELSQLLLREIVLPLLDRFGTEGPGAPITLAIDGTTCGRTGRHVSYAGYYKDASHTNVASPVIHWAHQWIIGVVLFRCKLWPRWVIALPMLWVLFRKKMDCDAANPFLSIQQIAAEMMRAVGEACPHRVIQVVADGQFATRQVVAALGERSLLISRIRGDAALHAPLPKRRRRRPGRPRKKGRRLASPRQMAKATQGWQRASFLKGGRVVKRKFISKVCLWPHVCGDRLVKVIVVRDLSRQQTDDFFVCTDPRLSCAQIAKLYYARWAIEEAIQDGKQHHGFEQVQGWCRRTVVRQAPIAMLIQTLVKAWFITAGHRAKKALPKGRAVCGWLPPKDHPSYRDMLATLRAVLWDNRINTKSTRCGIFRKSLQALKFTLAAAA